MKPLQTIVVERRGRIARVTLNRPDEANGINAQLAGELAAAAAEFAADDALRAVVLTGSGRFFCGGGDVKAMAGFGERTAAEVKRLADALHRAISTFTRMRAPVLVAVNGMAAGAGFSLAMSGDLVIAGDAARFVAAYGNVGLTPDGSCTYTLPRIIGLRRTQELLFTNRQLTAQEALDWGLVSRVVPAASLLDEAMKLAEGIAAGSPEANAGIKKLLAATFDNGLETQMEIEGMSIAACTASRNGSEGLRAINEKRRPVFE